MKATAPELTRVIKSSTHRLGDLQIQSRIMAERKNEIPELQLRAAHRKFDAAQTHYDQLFKAEQPAFKEGLKNLESNCIRLSQSLSNFDAQTDYLKARALQLRKLITWSLGQNLGMLSINMNFLAETKVQEATTSSRRWEVPVFATYDLNESMSCKITVVEEKTTSTTYHDGYAPLQKIMKMANIRCLDRQPGEFNRVQSIKTFLTSSREGLILPDKVRHLMRSALATGMLSNLTLIAEAEKWEIVESVTRIPEPIKDTDPLLVGKFVVPGNMSQPPIDEWFLLSAFNLIPAETNALVRHTQGIS